MNLANLVYYDNTPVFLGDSGAVTNGEVIVNFTVTEQSVFRLIDLGIIKEVSFKKPEVLKKFKPKENNPSKILGDNIKIVMEKTIMEPYHYHSILVSKMAKKGMNALIAEKALRIIKEINLSGYFSLILKEIALEMDSKYPDHISKSANFYTISSKDGKPYYVNINELKSIKSVALFRSEAEVIVACKILASLKKELFSGRK